MPAAFTPAQAGELADSGDVRLALAARSATDGQVIQFLAGAPELLARYRNASPAGRALIEAAMDARRLGMGAGLPQAFLEAAATGYLTDPEWDALGEDWLEQALAYTAVRCKGARGPLTRIRPRPARPGPGDRAGPPPRELADTSSGSRYRLADYLDQHGRAQRVSQIPPAEFWAAAAAHAAPADQAALGDAAHDRGLYRDAAQLHKNAAAYGNRRAALYLGHPPDCLRADPRPAHWAAAGVSLDDPGDVALLLAGLRQAGADGPAAALLARDPAARVSLDDPRAVARLLGVLREAGADGQAAALASRAAARVSLDDPDEVAFLLAGLREAGAPEQAAALASRAAARVSLDDPGAVALLLAGLWWAGVPEQATALLARDPAARVSLDDPRAAADTPLDHPDSLGYLLYRLWEVGPPDQAAALADRLPEAGMFELFLGRQGARDRFRFGREADGSPSGPWGWDDLD